MAGELGRFRMQRHRQPGCDVTFDDGLCAVVDDAAWDPDEVTNARRWQSQNVARSMLVVKQLNGSRECDNTRWNE
jgi:hypothetical protein